MSLLGAINSAVSALNSQSTVLSLVSNNLANSSTYGYKTVYGSFASLLTDTDSGTSSGGVTVSTKSNVSSQGTLVASTTATNIAIQGGGFFPVTTDGTSTYYTRNGEFSIDKSGYLSNSGTYLMGWATDSSGNITGGSTSASLTKINTNLLTSSAAATTSETLKANLPSGAAVGDTYTSDMTLYDSLGSKATTSITWTKTGDNTWTASFADPTNTSGTTSGTVDSSTSSIEVTFNSDGTLASTSPSPATLSISGWTTGASDSSVTLNFGTAGTATGMTQYADSSDTSSAGTLSLTATQDGYAYGTLTGVTVGEDGTVTAAYDNGYSRAIYKIPIATFTNADGLSIESNGLYAANAASGTATLNVAGTNGAGEIEGGELESSSTDTNSEFSTMMASQQAYSAAAQVVSTAKSMFETLISAVR